MAHIAETCAELALYRIMIKVDEILKHYTTDAARGEMEVLLWKLLESVQASEVLTGGANRNYGIS